MKIVLTGAPSSGKSSVLGELQVRKRKDFLMVPESAVVLLLGGFPAPAHDDLEQIRCFQKAILDLQENIEFIFERKNPRVKHMIFDRARLDGAAFWPPGIDDYIKNFKVDPQNELARYDAVIFMELPEENAFGGINKSRFHNYAQSLVSGKKLEEVWSKHPNFHKIPAMRDFSAKIAAAITTIDKLISES